MCDKKHQILTVKFGDVVAYIIKCPLLSDLLYVDKLTVPLQLRIFIKESLQL